MSNDYVAQMERPALATGRVRWSATVSLIMLTASLAEFLTGSTPLLAIVAYPIGFVFNIGLYGAEHCSSGKRALGGGRDGGQCFSSEEHTPWERRASLPRQ